MSVCINRFLTGIVTLIAVAASICSKSAAAKIKNQCRILQALEWASVPPGSCSSCLHHDATDHGKMPIGQEMHWCLLPCVGEGGVRVGGLQHWLTVSSEQSLGHQLGQSPVTAAVGLRLPCGQSCQCQHSCSLLPSRAGPTTGQTFVDNGTCRLMIVCVQLQTACAC